MAVGRAESKSKLKSVSSAGGACSKFLRFYQTLKINVEFYYKMVGKEVKKGVHGRFGGFPKRTSSSRRCPAGEDSPKARSARLAALLANFSYRLLEGRCNIFTLSK